MPQPIITDLFGNGSTFSGTPKILAVPLTALPALTSANPTALEIYAAIIQTAHTWINANTDTTVMAASDLTINSPITRNGTAKTQFQYAAKFYGNYTAPIFDPNAV
ncbi:hypothetical protein [Nostoc sp. NMS9]|uniref:hypothetical protein n=1 Tax=Nostoc sp. NMS9 TaxID=2815393 RepID=UPI0025DA8F05|nr:hypothetical protein [Nostoc sp. NMS9]MBN3939179.1 hypothetical protein [Nostoc sp. NMS9]